MTRFAILVLCLVPQDDGPDLSALKKRVLDSKAPPAARREAAVALAKTKAGGLFLIDLAGTGAFPKDLEPAVAEEIFKNPDFGVRALAEQHFRRSTDVEAVLKQVAKLKGDPAKGAKVFTNDRAACFKCHAFNGKGGDVGPDLTAIRMKYDAREILYNILAPSAAVSFGYEATLIKTKDEQIYSGVVLGDGEEIILKDAKGELIFIETAKIAAKKELKKSLMPDNISLGLSPQDMADLVAYLTLEPK